MLKRLFNFKFSSLSLFSKTETIGIYVQYPIADLECAQALGVICKKKYKIKYLNHSTLTKKSLEKSGEVKSSPSPFFKIKETSTRFPGRMLSLSATAMKEVCPMREPLNKKIKLYRNGRILPIFFDLTIWFSSLP